MIGARCPFQPGNWIAHIDGIHTVAAIKRHFKRQDHEHPGDMAPDSAHPSRPPGPDLRADEVTDRDPLFAQAGGQSQIEFRKIHQNGQSGRRLPDALLNPAEEAQVVEQIRTGRDRADGSQRIDACHQLNALLVHPGATTAEPLKAPGPQFPQSPDHLGGMLLTRGLSGNYQNRLRCSTHSLAVLHWTRERIHPPPRT